MTIAWPLSRHSEHHRHVVKDGRGENGQDIRSRRAEISVRGIGAVRQVTESAQARNTESVNALTRERDGRRNHYRINEGSALRHPLESQKTGCCLLTTLENK